MPPAPDGTEAAKADVPGHTRVALPPGKCTLSIDPDKWLKQFPDERRKMEDRRAGAIRSSGPSTSDRGLRSTSSAARSLFHAQRF